MFDVALARLSGEEAINQTLDKPHCRLQLEILKFTALFEHSNELPVTRQFITYQT